MNRERGRRKVMKSREDKAIRERKGAQNIRKSKADPEWREGGGGSRHLMGQSKKCEGRDRAEPTLISFPLSPPFLPFVSYLQATFLVYIINAPFQYFPYS
jgi:hypothetical protein